MTYVIKDRITGAQIGGEYKCRKRATRRADKLDMQYGAIRYRVEPVTQGVTA